MTAGGTIFPTEVDHREMHACPVFAREDGLQIALGFLDALPVGESPASGKPVDMRVHGKSWDTEGLNQHDTRRFVAHSGKGFDCFHLGRDESGVITNENLREGLDVLRFARREPTRTNLFEDLRRRAFGHCGWRTGLRKEPRCHEIDALVGGLRGKQHRHEQREGILVVEWNRRLRIEVIEDPKDALRLVRSLHPSSSPKAWSVRPERGSIPEADPPAHKATSLSLPFWLRPPLEQGSPCRLANRLISSARPGPLSSRIPRHNTTTRDDAIAVSKLARAMNEKHRRLIDWVPEGGLADPDTILDRFTRWCGDAGFSLYDAQEEALLELMTNRHVVLSTPTGSGKSLVAMGLHFKALCEGKRSFYTAPIKALTSEKFFALCNEFGAENVGMLTGDASINWGAPIICCTAEILANMALRQGLETDAPYVVMDEFHYFADRDRGWAWQVPLLILRKSRFLLMSATLGNTSALEERIQQRTAREVAHVHSDERPVPLDFSYLETPVVETVESLLASGREPIYMVHFTQRDAAEQAQGLTSGQITTKEEKRALAEAIGDFRFDSPYGKDIQRFLKFGIGLHHAGILPKYRLLVEQLAQRGLLKVICGTDTLGVGVNIPIRTVLFTKLSKFDGEKVGLLSVRNFKQIAGRAGRRGFDVAGSVVCQAPEHVIDNLRASARAVASGRKKEKKKKLPPRGFVGWSAETFEQLCENPPEILRSQFSLSHSAVVALVQRGADQSLPGSGYRELIELVNESFESKTRKKRLRREAAVLFRALRRGGIVRIEKSGARQTPIARIDADLQRDFGLHHTLSLYLVDAVAALDTASPDYALDVLSVVEAILENPRALLLAQVHQRKSELIAELKAERVPYEERMAKLEGVTWDKPNADFLYSTFDIFSTHHPWVGNDSVRPKSIAREIWEGFLSFEDYVRRYSVARMEGVLLRYLNQVHSTLSRNLPEAARNDEVMEVIAFFRAMLARVDSSLIEEWESLVNLKQSAELPEAVTPDRAPRRLDQKSFNARVRAEMHQLMQALSKRDFETASACVANDDWDAARFESEFTALFDVQGDVRHDPDARRGHWTQIDARSELAFDVVQTLIDAEGEGGSQIEAEVILDEPRMPPGPMLRILALRE
jgi:hypothetical protein